MAEGSASAVHPMRRPGYGSDGARCDLLCNHFAVTLSRVAGDVRQYDVTISYDDDPSNKQIIRKTLNRRLLQKVREELDVKKGLIFDGEKTLYSLEKLPFDEKEFKITMDKENIPRAPGAEETERSKKRRVDGSCFKIRISFSTTVDMKCLMDKDQVNRSQEALRVLDVLLREQAARREYVQLRMSYFHESLGRVSDLGEGVLSWRGYHASFRPCANGISLNLDPSTTIVIKPMKVHEFLADHLKKSPDRINLEDMPKAKRILKGIEVEAYTQTKHKIFGFSELPASEQKFEMREKGTDGQFSNQEVTVQEYYHKKYNTVLQYPRLFCVNVGKATRPVFIPMEFCTILKGQRYMKKLSGTQVRKLLDEARQKPNERIQVIQKGVDELLKNAEADLKNFNMSVEKKLMSVKGRLLAAPPLKFGKIDETPRDGRWNYNTKTVAKPANVTKWVAVSFGRQSENEVKQTAMQLKQVCNRKGINMDDPFGVFAENPRNSGRSCQDRVNMMRNEMRGKLPGAPSFVLCILPGKDSDLYAPFKRMFLTQMGIANQCMVPPRQLNDQYLTNVALKINAKCGGYNSVLVDEFNRRLPKISAVPTSIIGMDVSHGAPHSHAPSVAAVVASGDWPRITQYAARVMTQSAKQESIANICDGPDGGMLGQLLEDFKFTCEKKCYPEQLVIFRDGVSESQFESVLTLEMQAVVKACQDKGFRPKITLVVAQKRHHTRFFPANAGSNNISPGTVVDRDVTHPTSYDFFLSSQKGLIGTTRPTHYVCLHDEIGFTPDELQNMVNRLCYTYVKATTAVSVVSPVYYAHLAAQKARSFMSFDGSESGSTHTATSDSVAVPEMPKLHKNVSRTMFFV